MSTDHIFAENTYRLGLYCIRSGPWCAERLRREFGAPADYFDFPLDRSVYHPKPRQKTETNVVFFARPDMPRRCYGLGIHVLRELHSLMPEVEIILFGSSKIHEALDSVDFPITVLGQLPTINDLAQMYADADLGICFSPTNPSLIPYEMMASGLPVVDIALPGAEFNYGARADIALLASPVPKVMAKQMVELLRNPAELQARAQNGLELVCGLPAEEEMARQVERLILARVHSQQSAHTCGE